MGQYYNPCFIEKNEKNEISILKYFETWDYQMGSKLMEHSYLKNPLVRTIEKELYKNPTRVVWAGDYADEEEGLEENLYMLCEYYDVKAMPKLVKFVEDPLKVPYRYLINHDKKLYVDKRILFGDKRDTENYGLYYHPLPLLTCEGNGRGGGDYHTELDIIGSWSRDLISVDNINYKRVGYTELDLTKHFIF
jgi:hypothetical protein